MKYTSKFRRSNGHRGRRSLDHCSLITKCVKCGIGKPDQHHGVCFGYKTTTASPTHETCSECKRCYLYVDHIED